MSAIFWGRNSTARPRSVQKRPSRPRRIFPTSTQKTLRPCPERPTTFPTHIQLEIRNDLANTAQKRPARSTCFEFRRARVTSLLPPYPICAITNSFFLEEMAGSFFWRYLGWRELCDWKWRLVLDWGRRTERGLLRGMWCWGKAINISRDEWRQMQYTSSQIFNNGIEWSGGKTESSILVG